MSDIRTVYLGWDAREQDAYEVAHWSLIRRSSVPLHVQPLKEKALRARGLFTRQTEIRGGRTWDVPSQAWTSTEHANARFLIPFIETGLVLFCDADVLFLADVAELFAMAEPKFAVQVVHHDYKPLDGVKMDGQVNQPYARKNQSSVMLWNLDHPANRALTLDMVNALPGRDLHRFCWLDASLIGPLPLAWNWLEGISDPAIAPKLVHFTRGLPDMPGYEDVDYAGAWKLERRLLAAVNERRPARLSA